MNYKKHKHRLLEHASSQLKRSATLTRIWHKIPPEIWYFNKRSVAGGAAIGLFCAFVPLPVQVPGAILGAWLLKFNLPVALAMTTITNPITAYPIFYTTYKLGNWMLGGQPLDSQDESLFSSVFDQFQEVILPLVLGSLFVGLTTATLAYWSIKIAWQVYVRNSWSKRKKWRDARSYQDSAPHSMPHQASTPGSEPGMSDSDSADSPSDVNRSDRSEDSAKR